MKERTLIKFPPWLPAIICVALGLFICVFVSSYRFTGYLCIGIGAVIFCYRLLALLARRAPQPARILHRVLTVCLCLGILAAAITGGIVYQGSLGGTDTDCQYIIVLGAGVNGTVPSLTLRERINAAYEYLSAHPDTICVVSGGQGPNEDISEAACMYRELTEMGIDENRIWMECESTSTIENLEFTLALIEKQTGIRPDHLGIVSSEYHLYRAGLMAADRGLTSTGIPATTSWLSLRINYFLREIVAVWYYNLGRIFK